MDFYGLLYLFVSPLQWHRLAASGHAILAGSNDTMAWMWWAPTGKVMQIFAGPAAGPMPWVLPWGLVASPVGGAAEAFLVDVGGWVARPIWELLEFWDLWRDLAWHCWYHFG